MALPASPPLTLQQIYTEFGAPLGTNLTALVRGGAYVPDTPANAGVPTAPPINILNFLGASSVSVTLNGQSIFAAGSTGGGATARYRINAAGTVQTKEGLNPYVTQETWLLGGSASDFEVRATVQSQTGVGGFGGSIGTYLNCGTDREWTALATNGNIFSGTLLIEMRPAGGGAVLASALIDMESDFV